MIKPQLYLFFSGNCLKAMTHYAEVLGGVIEGVFFNSDAASPEARMPDDDDMVMNLALRLGDTVMMASDNSSDTFQQPKGFRVQIEMPTLAEFERVFTALAEGAVDVSMPPGATFWAERFAMFTDRFGTPWMMNFTGSKA
jgi:PhnB protein